MKDYTFFVGIEKGNCFIYHLEEVGDPETFAKEQRFAGFFCFTTQSPFLKEFYRLLDHIHQKTKLEMGEALMEFLQDFCSAIVANAEEIRESEK
jgi:hypothetical protein